MCCALGWELHLPCQYLYHIDSSVPILKDISILLLTLVLYKNSVYFLSGMRQDFQKVAVMGRVGDSDKVY